MSSCLQKKILSFLLCFMLILPNAVYADTVVIGAAPGTTGKNQSQAATTTYLQNQYTGPGTVPNSSTTGTSPIQGFSTDTSVGQTYAMVDNNGVADSGPNYQTITSPGAHNAYLASNTNTAKVIANGASFTGNNDTGTEDKAPQVTEIKAPKAGGEYEIESSGAYINGEWVPNYGPGYSKSGNTNTTNTSNTTNTTNTTTTQSSIPSYTTGGSANHNTQVNYNTGIIKYDVNPNIQAQKPSIQAPGALVVNATTRQIYFSKGGFDAFHPASLANLVTAYLLVSSKGLDDVLTVSQTAVSNLESGATTAGLKAGDVITVRDAIGAMFVKSCCDVANVVAENVAGNIPTFVGLMNQTVKNWGCVGTNFTNANGLNSDAQVTNTYDMAVIMDKVTSNAALKLMLQQTKYTLPATAHRGTKTLTTSNLLLVNGNANHYAGISASRMGYTSKTKYTIVSELDYNGQRIIAVVLKANGSQYTDSKKLLNFAKVASLEAGASGTNYAQIQNQAQMQYQANNAANAANAAAAVSNASNASNASSAVPTTGDDTIGNWMQDSQGWYFIKANGARANNEWIKQNGKIYCIDSTGYMIKGWRQMSNGNTYYFDPISGEFRFNTWVNVSTGAYYLQADGSLAKASPGTTKNITTQVGTYTIDENGKAIAKVS